MIVNGVTLPDIPDKVLELSQYYIIHRMYSDTSEIYSIRVLPNAAVYFPPGMITEYGTLYSPEYYTFNLSTDGNEWIDAGSGVGELAISIGVVDGVTDELLFSNHDIYEVTSVNAETGEFTTGEIYFPNSEAEEEPEETKPPRYSIATAILDAVARQIMRLTDSTKKVKPEEFEPKLEGINIQLQELTVTATEEVQTIYPDRGYYGFSKIIVEAVEDSGSGGGTPGGGDGSDGDTNVYPDAENTTFGCTYEEVDVETGKVIYGNAQHAVPPYPPGYAYCVVTAQTQYYYAYMFNEPVYYDPNKNGLYSPSQNTGYKQTRINYTNSEASWETLAAGILTSYFSNVGDILLSTFDLMNKDGSVRYYAASSPTPETTKETVMVPIEAEDTYTISGETLTSLNTAIQKLTGSEATTPSEMAEALETYISENTTTE